jgi:hypothetical protein
MAYLFTDALTGIDDARWTSMPPPAGWHMCLRRAALQVDKQQ